MTTTADVLAECRNDYLMTGAHEARNTLNGAVNNSTATFNFNFDSGPIGAGSRICVDLEDCYVWTPGTKTATVSRGDFGSTAATHADGAVVTINPRFSDSQILRSVNHELQALSSPSNGLFQIKSVTVTYNPVVDGYDLSPATAATLLDVYRVRYQAIGPQKEWPIIPFQLWEHALNLPTSVFSSGQAIFVRGYVDPSRPILVEYKAAYSPLATVTDNVLTTSGLHVEAHDILALGAGIRLTAGREIRRNFDETQGSTRRATEVPPGANLGANRGLQQLYQQRIRQEYARLTAQYPMAIR